MIDRKPKRGHPQEEMVPTMDKDKEIVKKLQRVRKFYSFHPGIASR